MNCIVIGLGYFGSILKSKLEKLGYNVITVDPYNEKADLKSISSMAAFEDDRYFITTPASTHHSILLDLFSKGVKNIWVEKPVCPSLEDTLDIFSKKPDDTFLYCDFTWLQHNSVKRLGNCESVKHIEMKWLNNGTMIPKDVNIVEDLAIHPISILMFLLIKSKKSIRKIHVPYANEKSVLINGVCDDITFNIEVSNTSMKKSRNISLYCKDNVYRWSSENEFFIENIGDINKTDAIEMNIKHFMNKNSIGYPLDIARTLETVNKAFRGFD
jgi:predicted dehydrogenase